MILYFFCDPLALARGVFQTLPVENVDFVPAVSDPYLALYGARGPGVADPPHAEPVRKEFLGHAEVVGLREDAAVEVSIEFAFGELGA